MAIAYRDMGHKVIVRTSDINHSGLTLPEYEVAEDIHIYRYRVNAYSGPMRYVRHWQNAVAMFKQIRLAHNPGIVICRYHQSCLMMKLAGFQKIKYLVPGVVKYQNAPHQMSGRLNSTKARLKFYFDYYLNLFLQHRALKGVAELFVFSENMRRQVSSIVPGLEQRINITKPGVDLERFRCLSREDKLALRARHNMDFRGPVFFCIGRFVRAKGFDLAIQAMAETEGAQLWIVGSGDEHQTYETLINEARLHHRVRLLPATSEPELYYMMADYFIMSSRYEPLGQTLLEAMAAGLPVIAFSQSENVETATSEVLGPGVGYYAEQANASALAGAMKNALVGHDSEEYGREAARIRMLAQKKYTWQALCEVLASQVNSQ